MTLCASTPRALRPSRLRRAWGQNLPARWRFRRADRPVPKQGDAVFSGQRSCGPIYLVLIFSTRLRTYLDLFPVLSPRLPPGHLAATDRAVLAGEVLFVALELRLHEATSAQACNCSSVTISSALRCVASKTTGGAMRAWKASNQRRAHRHQRSPAF